LVKFSLYEKFSKYNDKIRIKPELSQNFIRIEFVFFFFI